MVGVVDTSVAPSGVVSEALAEMDEAVTTEPSAIAQISKSESRVLRRKTRGMRRRLKRFRRKTIGLDAEFAKRSREVYRTTAKSLRAARRLRFRLERQYFAARVGLFWRTYKLAILILVAGAVLAWIAYLYRVEIAAVLDTLRNIELRLPTSDQNSDAGSAAQVADLWGRA